MRQGLFIGLMVVLVWFCPTGAKAQDAVSVSEEMIAELYEQYAAESNEQPDYESFYDDLMYCASHPINLNNTHREALGRLPFLSELQIENLLAWIYEHGRLSSLFELRLIDGFDMTDIRRMLPFVILGEPDTGKQKIYMRELLQKADNELMLRFDKGLERKAGYTLDSALLSPYAGSEWYHSIKYRYNFRSKIQAGFSAEKDAGEAFWNSTHKGYDFYSAHLQLSDLSRFKTIVLGDYRANFGLGLVVHSDFAISKSASVLQVLPRNNGLRRFASTAESGFFRGVGTTFTLGKSEVSVFYSNQKLDGDTTGGVVPSLLKTGYHRTSTELLRRNSLTQQSSGANFSYQSERFQLGVTLLHTWFDKPLLPGTEVYNHFYMSGKKQTTAGVSYRWRWQQLIFAGEMAATSQGAPAMLTTCMFNPVSSVTLVLLQRYYSPRYNALLGSTFSESSRPSNESGYYIGAEIRTLNRWKFSVYADSYRFAWPKFGIDAPTLGSDYLLQADYAPQSRMSMYWRFRYKDREIGISPDDQALSQTLRTPKFSLRYQLRYRFGNWNIKNMIDANLTTLSGVASYGLLAEQQLSYSFSTIPLNVDVACLFFDARQYENRLYCYESDILHAFSVAMLAGQGSRLYLNLRYDATQKISLWFKVGQTLYADGRETIGSANETIRGSRKTDARIMLRWEF